MTAFYRGDEKIKNNGMEGGREERAEKGGTRVRRKKGREERRERGRKCPFIMMTN